MERPLTFDFDLTVTLSLILSVITLAFAWIRTRRQDLEGRIASGAARTDAHDLRIVRLEQALGSLPARDDMHRLQIALTEMRGDMRTMQATMVGQSEIMKRLETIVTRHEDHLLDGAKR